MKPGETRFL